jgi:ERCC4-type nuclease
MEVGCVIDCREEHLKPLLLQHPDVQYRALDVGDVLLTVDNMPIVLVERKSIADLCQSIKDGRYREQKLRLKAWREAHPQCKLVLLFEGGAWRYGHVDTDMYNGIPWSALKSAAIHNMFKHGMYVVHTQDIHETAAFLRETLQRVKKDPASFLTGGESVAPNYMQSIQIKKNKNITPDNIMMAFLCQIPGVSSKIAEAIAKQHHRMVDLVTALSSMEHPVQYLATLPVSDKRKLGPKLASNIHSFIMGDH